MNNSLIVCFLFSMAVAGIHCQQSCGILRPRTCGENECCLLTLLGFCAPLRRENQRCGGLLQCPCAPGLQCKTGRGQGFLRFLGICVRANSTTTTQRPSTLTDIVTDITDILPVTTSILEGTVTTPNTQSPSTLTDIVTDITDTLPVTTSILDSTDNTLNTVVDTDPTPVDTSTPPPTTTTTAANT